mmetsp:Transcript_56200/g.64150  ORF Transcript_56200/g.64150 Transcript_56200/m.64150 type:complete len:346 (+) Transcript_56200:66-1103(+)
MPPKFKKMNLALDDFPEEENPFMENSMTCVFGPEGLKFVKENFEVKKTGITNTSTGEGQQLSVDDLEIGPMIGRGSSGIVQRAVIKGTGVAVAIKSINAYDKDKRKQLLNDIRALDTAKCPFLVRYYGGFFQDGHVKIALEFMDRGSLKSLLESVIHSKTIIPENVLARMTLQIIHGLIYLHRITHQIHRDIKPDNILMSSNGSVKLTDFGISRELPTTQTHCETFCGTATYMSPERISGKKYSYPSDIWSLGLVILELAIQKYPYPRPTIYLEVAEFVLNSDEPRLPEDSGYSLELANFIECCIKRAPEERATAIQLAAHPWIIKNCYSEDVDVTGWIDTLKKK